ncbi:DUF6503 family protein [Flagellimonas meridianipacifica]|uniref:Deoxyribose-phosphate aldolase n=1 Tax=Flagellimonas meridianipacifica TaxID=1080225 RepID=A0A2T0MF11_9FLAO|nr:DUF6503 family protein [Allomuricauda pacifica]PRX56152.1 hypothetical protein CLV81_0144 [Allomuricauda pacifica]
MRPLFHSQISFWMLLGLLAFLSPNFGLGQESIIDKAIRHSGAEKLKNAEVSFDFREYHYIYKRHKGRFEYTRIDRRSDGTKIRDVYTNDGLFRYVADTLVSLSEKRKKAYANSVNSVIYFAFLPLWLKDPAVMFENMGISKIQDKEYHKIRVTFKKEGGGDDFEDVFLYWFDADDYSLDYLAYKYFTGKGGMRFREAYNPRTIDGVRIQDYRNFAPKLKGSIDFEQIDRAFEDGKLEELSIIALKKMTIRVIP